MTGRNIGYARTAIHGQEINAQIEALKEAGCTDIYTDNGVSGLTLDRPGLQQARNALQSGDALTVCRLDRISRSLEEFTAFRTELRDSGIQLVEIGQRANP